MEVTIDRYTKKGLGVGDGVEVIGSVIGDRLEVEKWRRKKGALLSVLTPSKDRVAPQCSHSGSCGGCSWQQVAYSAQLQEKQRRIEVLFDEPVAPIIPCEMPFRYRNKMEFSFSQNKAGDRFLGLMLAGSRGHVLNVNECFLVSPWFSETLTRVRAWWKESGLEAYRCHTDSGALRTLTLREGIRTGSTLAMLTVSGNPDYGIQKDLLSSFVEAVGGGSVFVRIQQLCKGKPTQFYEMHLSGPEHLYEELCGYRFAISPSSFFQPNTIQAEKLYNEAVRMARLSKEMTVFDLYCGTASLGMAFAPHVGKVIGIELNPYAVYDGLANIAANGLTNIEVHQGDVGEVLQTLDSRADIAIVDPPRSGLDREALRHLLALRPRQILYVSCNPVTQKENIETLKAAGYFVQGIQPVDQFPHTPHIENIVHLS